jgi:hypothetical protein
MGTNFDWYNPKGTDRSEDIGVDTRIILTWMVGKSGVKLFHLVQKWKWWGAVVNNVTNLQVP